MNEVLSAIMDRRSVRSYKSDKVERNVIEQILEAARWAPSGNNLQPWKFVVVTEAAVIGSLAESKLTWVQSNPTGRNSRQKARA
ncbi:MAG: nitroreductase family protein [Bacillota bacterium]